MKSNKLLAVGIVMHLLTMAITLFAETEKVGDYTWQYFVRDGKAWIGSQVAETAAIFPKPVGEVTVPSELGGYEVFRLDSYALYGCDEMTKIVIPDCVHQMGGSAVAGCSALGKVLLPEKLEYIAGKSFCDCTSLKEMLIPERVEKIDARAFQGCTSLANIVIPSSVRRIGQDAFYNCKSLADVIVPNSVTNIDKYAFSCCTGLRSLTLPFIGSQRGNTGSEESVFGHLFGVSASNGLTAVDQANVVRYIPSSLNKVVVTDETVVDMAAFNKCTMLKEIKLNEGIEHIGQWAFAWCCITNMVIPNSVTNMERGVFAYCAKLESLTLPFAGAYRGNTAREDCVFGWVFETFGSGYNSEEAIPVRQWYRGGNQTVYVPKTLRSVIITDETIIPYGAFQNCSNLTSVVIGNSVTHIAKGAFSGCGSLESMTLPFTGKSRDALEWNIDHCECSLGYIFGSDSYSGSVGVKAYGSSGFSYYYLPVKLTSIAVIGTEQIRSYAFYNCSTLTNITIDADAKSMGYQTFGNCKGLKQIEIPDGVVGLGSNTFRGSGLESIFIPLSVTDMTERKGANFLDCTSLHLAYIPRRFKGKLNENTFANCADDLQVIYYTGHLL